MAQRIIVIGGGPGGYAAALRAAQLGASVTLVEKENPSGTCLNWGCIPSKIMKHTGELYDSMQHATTPGILLEGALRFDIRMLQSNKEKLLESQRRAIAALLGRAKVKIMIGQARVICPGEVEVTAADGACWRLTFETLIIAAGTVPGALPDIRFDQQYVLSSNDLLSMDRLPQSLTIAGGGVVGCEFASIFSALGVRVTIVEALNRLLPLRSVDGSISKLLLREMKKRGIKVYLNTIVHEVRKEDSGVLLELAPATGEPEAGEALNSDALALCVGRIPCSRDLGLESVGVRRDSSGFIVANEKMETTAEGVYAIGDILGPEKLMLAHCASQEGFVAAANAMGADQTMDYDNIPTAIFTMPEAASVGLTETEAVRRGFDLVVESVNFRNLGKAQATGTLAGEAKLIAEKRSGKLLGLHLCGAHATDLIGEAGLAVTQGLRLQDLACTIHPHPTFSEIFSEVAMKALGHPLHG